MSIIVSEGGKHARRVERSVIEQEDYLQKYIYDNPESLPLDDIKDDLKLLVLAREFPTGSGPIDLLAVDQDADIYLIETKLYKNPDKRLVVAQVLDYGASLWTGYADGDQFLTKLDQLMSAGDNDGLAARLGDVYSVEGDGLNSYLDTLKTTIRDGRFRFVVLMDRVDSRLKDLIRFVNSNSQFDLLGVELDFYEHDKLHILIPHLYGAESRKAAGQSMGGSRRKWDEPTFFADVSARLSRELGAWVRKLYEWAQDRADAVTWGTGVQRGSFNVKVDRVNVKSIFSVYSDGTISLNFPWLRRPERSAEYSRRLGQALREIAELKVPADFVDNYVSVPAEAWTKHYDEFVHAVETSLGEK